MFCDDQYDSRLYKEKQQDDKRRNMVLFRGVAPHLTNFGADLFNRAARPRYTCTNEVGLIKLIQSSDKRLYTAHRKKRFVAYWKLVLMVHSKMMHYKMMTM